MVKKTNYVNEALYRIDTMYGSDMSDEELEWTRRNRFFTMSEGGNTMSLDEVNELLNLWNKEMVTSPNFETVCEHSKYVMFHRACQMDSFGVGNRRSTFKSNEDDVSKLVALLEKIDIFPANNAVKRKMSPNFFWDFVRRPTNVGSTTDKAKESVTVTTAQLSIFDPMQN